ncbi:methylthioribose-1-phosphate isomerase [Desulfatibacillum alkenivorans DSM 16219]|jgi:methylthioribose-1-phosphate isomerase|uniref:Methylthioribose-1-phosphate isomerase n=1 Tax=Desulfatibacillum alkenivorans DSM 16219 TaxID=1121393 RepID=A0A1M6FQR4_9BACT|nr:S-methyl-5-thioribose-1-phosphate isomerase [Desulfatibacillum alkenivorans]SHJ00052.1 methylthioribose-1-phosphate isomerase [Desulfatibacillum alkenivorans DSM 16219]
MNVNGKWYRAIWPNEHDPETVEIIDQRKLPHRFEIVGLTTAEKTIQAIRDMYVRGAPLIGATGAWGVYLAVVNMKDADNPLQYLKEECFKIGNARPTAVNLEWAVKAMETAILEKPNAEDWLKAAWFKAIEITEAEVENCRQIGLHGSPLIEEISKKKNGKTVNILTHCNAGWLACVDHGTATAPIYAAFDKGIDVHVWVDETRPLNQGSRLTAWELGQHGVPHTVITDNAGGHLMQHGKVDMVIVGTDRTTHTGDAANKVGTYLKALAAKDNNVPFYVALPSSTIDWELKDGVKDIPIENRDPDEVRKVWGLHDGHLVDVLVPPEDSPALNVAFDVTPARLVTGLITERGLCKASEDGVRSLFPDKMK